MFVRQSHSAINLITDRFASATLAVRRSRRSQAIILVATFFLLGCLASLVAAQQVQPPQEALPPPSVRAEDERLSEWPQGLPGPLDQADLPDPFGGDQDPQSPDADPRNVLMSGPMHEAFLEVHEADPEPHAIVPRQPPEPIDEVPPEYKPEGENVLWIPGYWGWDFEQEDFVWISGVWRDVPPDRQWIPGYWQEVDEGYRWVSGYWQQEAVTEIDYLPKPPPSIDTGPSTAAPGENYFYVPGNWVMHHSTYRWSPGYWQACVNDWVWIPARYYWSPFGYVFRPGYWDRIIHRRGVLFAPIHFATPYYRRVGYRYTPRFVIRVGVGLLPHLFVNLRHGHFYYGDWYGLNYRRHGLYPWVDPHRHFRRYYDPLWAYYSSPIRRYQNRNPYAWARDYHYQVARRTDLRPARTFATPGRQNAVPRSLTIVDNSVTIGLRYADLVASSGRRGNQLGQSPGRGNRPDGDWNFRRLSAADIAREARNIQPIEQVRIARRAHETRSSRLPSDAARQPGRSGQAGRSGQIARSSSTVRGGQPSLKIESRGNPARRSISLDRPNNDPFRFSDRESGQSAQRSPRLLLENAANSALGGGAPRDGRAFQSGAARPDLAGNRARPELGERREAPRRSINGSLPDRTIRLGPDSPWNRLPAGSSNPTLRSSGSDRGRGNVGPVGPSIRLGEPGRGNRGNSGDRQIRGNGNPSSGRNSIRGNSSSRNTPGRSIERRIGGDRGSSRGVGNPGLGRGSGQGSVRGGSGRGGGGRGAGKRKG